jgi:16S rRNA (guanine527-N7)-methyltransferase
MKSPTPPCDPRELLVAGCNALEIPVRDDAIDHMMRHMQLVREWNAKLNLTTITDPIRMAILHFLDSLSALKVIPTFPGLRIMDVGAGGGFPGMVLCAVEPSWHLTVLDRDPKKIVFLKHVARELSLGRVVFLNSTLDRILKARDPDLVQDVVVSRAFSSDRLVLDSLFPLLRPHGNLVRMTGPATLEDDLDLPHFRVSSTWQGALPFSDTFRRVVLYERREEAFLGEGPS